MAVGIGICYGGYDLGTGTLQEPGSGFMFFWVGALMTGLSLAILFPSLGHRDAGDSWRALWGHVRWKKLLSILGALFVYAYALKFLGFIPSTMVLLVFLFKAVESQKWSWAIVGAVVSTLAAYGLFHIWLGCQLPRGLFWGG